MKKLQKVMGICLKIFLFLSSYIPLFIMVFLNSMNQISIISVIKTWNLNPTLWINFFGYKLSLYCNIYFLAI